MNIDDKDIPRFREEQRTELMESIRHFAKYKSFAQLNSAFATPGEADCVHDSMMKLYEEHFEHE